jgi:hypothetical protein
MNATKRRLGSELWVALLVSSLVLPACKRGADETVAPEPSATPVSLPPVSSCQAPWVPPVTHEEPPLCQSKSLEMARAELLKLEDSKKNALALVEGEHEVPARWTIQGDKPPALAPKARTVVRVGLQVTKILRRVPAPGSKCTDSLTFLADVTLKVEDGVLLGHFEGAPVSVHSPNWASVVIATDLRHVTGTLRLPSDLARPCAALGTLELDFRPGHVRGRFSPTLEYQDRLWEERNAPRYADLNGLALSWPGDDCPVSQIPVSLDTLPPRFGGRSVRDVFEQARAAVRAHNPLRAVWGSARIGVSFEPQAPEPRETVCMREQEPLDSEWSSSFSFRVPVKIHSTDHRIDTTRTTRFWAEMSGASRLTGVSFEYEGPQVPASEFEATQGFRGAELEGSPCAAFRFASLYELGRQPSRIHGQVEADGFPCGKPDGTTLEYLRWCSGSDCPKEPRPWYPTAAERSARGE